MQLGPADLDRLDDQERQWEQHDQGDEGGGARQQPRQGPPPGVVPANPPGRAHNSWASWSNLMASAPVPSSATVIPFGCNWSNGVSGCAVVTPEAIGYSKLSL